MNSERTSATQLRHGNPSGDPHVAPRCGARNRRGLPCRAPAMKGKRRCRLHGGLSTGPTTLGGIARLRAAHTKHGRFSAEGLAVEQWRRRYFSNGYRSIRALARELGQGLECIQAGSVRFLHGSPLFHQHSQTAPSS
jgi:hypothetical protein